MSTHRAAILPANGCSFTIEQRQTPDPGPGELLVAVKSVAINPADWLIRDLGLFISKYPTVIGFDLAGLVVKVGPDVPTSIGANDKSSVIFRPGVTRVAAYSASFWRGFKPDYGAFQEYCLIPWQHAVVIPDHISWNEAATLPVSAQVPLSAWDAMGIPRLAAQTETVLKKDEALLIWGASSSVGTMGVQSGRLLKGDRGNRVAAVYATAGPANLEYLRSLGADRVFDRHDPNVVDNITAAAHEDGLAIRPCFLAIGVLSVCQDVLKSFVKPPEDGTARSIIASAPPVPADITHVDGVEVVFLQPASGEEERLAQFKYWMGTWLGDNLAKGAVRPSPAPKVIRGLETIDATLNMQRDGVSCTKLVIEISE